MLWIEPLSSPLRRSDIGTKLGSVGFLKWILSCHTCPVGFVLTLKIPYIYLAFHHFMQHPHCFSFHIPEILEVLGVFKVPFETLNWLLAFLSPVQNNKSTFSILTFLSQEKAGWEKENLILGCKSLRFFSFCLWSSWVTMKRLFEFMLSLNVSGNLSPRRLARDLKQKMVPMTCVAGLSLSSRLIREVTLWIVAWKAALLAVDRLLTQGR